MGKQFVKDLKVGSHVFSQFVVVAHKTLSFSAPSRQGEYFIKLLLGDVSGTIKGIIWNSSMVRMPIRTDEVLLVNGEVEEYNGLQLVINDYSIVEKEKVNRSHFQATCPRDNDEMWRGLLEIVSSAVSNEHLTRLLNIFYNDQDLVKGFRLSPAAKSIHHNYLGGLLEHTLEVVEICEHLIKLYPEEIDRSLLITAAIFHDIGKIEEYNADSFTFEQTDKGKLLGHITIGLEMVRKMIESIPSFPDDLKMKLEHMIISHHGEKEWGSPEVPQTFEAFALFHADLLSARLKQISQLVKKHNGKPSAWTEWDRFLGRRVFTAK